MNRPPYAPDSASGLGRPALLRAGALLAIALAAAPASAWVSSTATDTDPTPAHWDLQDAGTDQQEVVGGRVVYRLQVEGSDDVSDASDLDAVRSAFRRWEAVPSSVIAWTEGPATSVRSIGDDGLFPVFWDEAGAFPLSGALAVTFTYVYTSGPEKGEIVDTNIVFNGRDYSWSTDGSPGTYDIESVATHEIGHSFGLDHSPSGSATMWPYTAPADFHFRSLSSDDVNAVTTKYPAGTFAASTGSVRGIVARSGGTVLHGAHVVLSDADGNVVATTLSLADGSYAIEDLEPGTYTVYAESIGTPRFGVGNLAGYYAGADTGFPAIYDPEEAAVSAGLPTVLDLLVPAGSATLVPRYVGRTDASLWTTDSTRVTAGEGTVEIGLAAENMPTTGNPLSVSGSDLPVLSTRFASVGGFPAALITLDVGDGVVPGERTLVVESAGERARATAALEVLPGSGPGPDSDGDSILDTDEGAPNRDTDGDGTPDYLDPDSDGDTILDAHEAGDTDPATPPVDTDGDTVPDFLDLDSDADTVLDAHEAGDAVPATPPVDTDGDTVADFRDPDSDRDTIADAQEAGDTDPATPPADTDGDGIPDLRDLDSDGDTILDEDEAGDVALSTLPRDADGDTVPDFRDPDSDGDGLADAVEAGDDVLATRPVDTDTDGTPDFLDLDSDDDGAPDGAFPEDASDFDGDGLANFRDPDADDGGEPDGSELAGGRNPLDPADDLTGPPGEVPDGRGGSVPVTLRRQGPTGLALSWGPASGATTYRVYRGTVATLHAGGWDAEAGTGVGACDTAGATAFADPDETGDGLSAFYLVSGLNAVGEGPLGASRPAGTASCP